MEGASPFVERLWRVTSEIDPEVASWDHTGSLFVVKQSSAFQRAVGRYFNCSWNSFIRQLLLYGFEKSDCRRITWQFSHPHFKRDEPWLLPKLKRKPPNKGTSHTSTGANKRAKISAKATDGARVKRRELDRVFQQMDYYHAQNLDMFKQLQGEYRYELKLLKDEIKQLRKQVSACSCQNDVVPRPQRESRRRKRSLDAACDLHVPTDCDLDDDLFATFGPHLNDLFAEPTTLTDHLTRPLPVATTPKVVFVVRSGRVAFGEQMFAQFLNRFVAVAEHTVSAKINLIEKTGSAKQHVAATYPLIHLQKFLNPITTAVLLKTIDADIQAHEQLNALIDAEGAGCPQESRTSNSCVTGEEENAVIFEFEYHGSKGNVYTDLFAPFLSNVLLALLDPTGESFKFAQSTQPACTLYSLLENYLTERTKEVIAASQYFVNEYDSAKSRRLDIQG